MKKTYHTAAVITAAGLSSRMHDFKPLLPLGGKTMGGILIDSLRKAGVSPIYIVTGHKADELKKYLSAPDVHFFHNVNFRTTEMFDSLAIGLKAVYEQKDVLIDKVFITPIDIPCVLSSTLQTLSRTDADVAIPTCHGRKGHPVCIRKHLIPDILSHSGDGGLKGALISLKVETKLIETDDPGILADADTKEEYEKLQRLFQDTNQTSFDALIVAAGQPRRQSDFSPSQKLGSLSVIRRIIQTLRQAGGDTILVVTGYQAKELEHHLAGSGVIFLRNEDWETTDMMHSVKLGLSKLMIEHPKKENSHLIFTPADIPLFTFATVKKLLASKASAAVPAINGKSGHPLLLSKNLLPALLSYTGDQGLKDAIKKSGTSVVPVSVDDEGILFDAEIPCDCESLLYHHNRQPFFPHIHVSLERELSFFDRDTALLLHLVAQTRSVRKACSMMGVSYSKGWKLLNEMELQSGITIITRRAGGQTGGSTELTEEGLDFLSRFEAYERRMKQVAITEFYKIFPEMEERDE